MELGTKLSWVRDIQGGLVPGAGQLASDADRKPIQNAQRSENQREVINRLYIMRELIGGGGNRPENILTQQKSTSVDGKLEGINKAIPCVL